MTSSKDSVSPDGVSEPTTYEVTKYPGVRFVLKDDYEKMKALAEKLAKALEYLWNSPHEGLLYREENKKSISEILSLAREMGVLK